MTRAAEVEDDPVIVFLVVSFFLKSKMDFDKLIRLDLPCAAVNKKRWGKKKTRKKTASKAASFHYRAIHRPL